MASKQNGNYNRGAINRLKKYDIVANPSLLSRLKHFILGLTILGAGIFGVLSLPKKGIMLNKLVGLNINLLKHKLSYEFLAYPLYAIIGIAFFYLVYHYAYIKLYTVKVSEREMVEDKNIFGGEDPTDLNNVTDCDVPNNPILALLGIRNLVITIRGRKELLILKGFKKHVAREMSDYIRAHSYENYTEYRVDKDKERRQIRNSEVAYDRKHLDVEGVTNNEDHKGRPEE